MLAQDHLADIRIPFPEPPEPGSVREVAPGILWLRFHLPFLLNHVNVYLIEDRDEHGPGWAAFDTGLGTDATKAAWDLAFAGPLAGQRLTRIVCSHFHPDHVGLVGWLVERFGCPLSMPRTEFLMTRVLENRVMAADPTFYTERGLAVDAGGRVAGDGHGYLRMVTGLPTRYHRLVAGQSIGIGGRDWEIFTGGGHSPEQAMLYCAADRIFLSADQVLLKISPNISVQSMEPDANPLGEYLASLTALGRAIAADALVLPGHGMPFHGLHVRLRELADHHAARCELVVAATRAAPHTAADLLPVMFKRQMDAHQTGFAFGEVLAHVNYMRARGELDQARDADGKLRVRAA
jgi:glyoxylase-like metal-dependent hydrolase (beta-lactamase superfamily II)